MSCARGDLVLPWKLDGLERPWGGQASWRGQIRAANVAAVMGGERFEAGGRVLVSTDEDYGARLRRSQVRSALMALAKDATAERLEHLYSLVTHATGVPSLAAVSSADAGVPRMDERVHAIGVLFAREAPVREAVEFGVVLLAHVESFDERELLLELGVDVRLTPVVAFALARQQQGEQSLFELAKRVDGWAKIHTVERLAETTNPDIQAWLLRDGFRNSEMNEHLAFTCAMAGHLHEALAATNVDDALLRGTADIFVALANGGPAPDLADYPFRAVAIRRWLNHLTHRELELCELTALDALSQCPEVPAELAHEIDVLRATPRATALIELGLRSPDPDVFEHADTAALRRGLDTFAHHERRVRSGGAGLAHSVFRMMQGATPVTIERALEAADAACFGPESTSPTQVLLQHVVVELARFPGRGERFLIAALHSPQARTRIAALCTLEAWPRERCSPALIAALT